MSIFDKHPRADELAQRAISTFMCVWVYFKDKERNGIVTPASTYIVPKEDVDRFVTAQKQLHFEPGKNPHNGNTTAVIYEIKVAPIQAKGPFWWTVPGLQKNNDYDNGATIMATDYNQKMIWRHPEYQALLEEDRREEMRAEQEM